MSTKSLFGGISSRGATRHALEEVSRRHVQNTPLKNKNIPLFFFLFVLCFLLCCALIAWAANRVRWLSRKIRSNTRRRRFQPPKRLPDAPRESAKRSGDWRRTHREREREGEREREAGARAGEREVLVVTAAVHKSGCVVVLRAESIGRDASACGGRRCEKRREKEREDRHIRRENWGSDVRRGYRAARRWCGVRVPTL